MKSETTFFFSGKDSLSQFMVWIILFGAGCMPLPFLLWGFSGKTAALTSIVIAVVVTVGLRASISVSPSGVVITKSWFFIPYWRFKGKSPQDVWFGGDWGEPEGAAGVVVQVDGKEIHIGSRRSMHQLREALLPLLAKRVVPPFLRDDSAPGGSTK